MGELAQNMVDANGPNDISGASIKVFEDWQTHFKAPAQSTHLALLSSLRTRYMGWNVVVTDGPRTALISFAKAGHATAVLDTNCDVYVNVRGYQPPKGRISTDQGELLDHTSFGKYDYSWNGHSFIIYHAEFEDDGNIMSNLYILSRIKHHEARGASTPAADSLITAASKWNNELHDEILVFDQQHWTKDKELFAAVRSANWDDVILDKDMKQGLIKDAETFFDCEQSNGKTISVKALMHSLASRRNPVPTLYVKSLAGCGNSWYAIRQIFVRARQYSPCLLLFEDLDSLVNDDVKSFFLNEVDGLEDNNGIMMIGSTNHLERLDAGISKRPGRFDRKYHFALPATPERTAYCNYWRKKLLANDELEFPEELNDVIASVIQGFSFAYLREVFVTSLLTIVGAEKGTNKDIEDIPAVEEGVSEPDRLLLWRVIKKQIQTLRSEMEGARKSAEEAENKSEE
ncbi:uncharacterized protein KY384_003126 [Bacidia gigantensis]|uniref:uncharacterized protein n=1 Tax=Bacidia gigantensis TaxID=2732470 RepID=UPI001D041BEC|nr:uncharacterized protein KY384_003126 [Bacidia gigantensis]KAG8531497.1 hypothetical protein KY384_003126 [Bacidia gigantensis]